ncbi:metal-dependent hydrolase [Hugenholtzia roseola]|uniref:metal-dependent hydrolase n=1 Tax=Hugenholtzia roseola TaxID=1002 RepID=UPI000411B8D6|nr:metal-dependent hydrolase [Hugenholtzia roseola]
MDSLTQIVLGAAVGEAALGRKIGNQALFWGAVAGTIPDLDVLANPFQDVVEQLQWHRSLTHSLLFAIIVSPLFAFFIHKIKRYSHTTFWEWFNLFFWGFVTHALLDTCTTWGTQLLYPFYNYGFATKTVFVIDPLYTLPFLYFVIVVAFTRYRKNGRYNPKRRRRNLYGLGISTCYLILGFVLKFLANQTFEQALQNQNIPYSRYDSKVTALNIVLWNVVAETEEGYYSGYYSFFDADKNIKFNYFPKNWKLLEPYRENEKVQILKEITQGYYSIETTESEDPKIKRLKMNDLRFGQVGDWQGGKGEFVFVYHLDIEEKEGESPKISFSQKPNRYQDAWALFKSLFHRLLGNKS